MTLSPRQDRMYHIVIVVLIKKLMQRPDIYGEIQNQRREKVEKHGCQGIARHLTALTVASRTEPTECLMPNDI